MTKHSSPKSICPCGSEKEYQACCGPVLEDHKRALTAEILMRSRYTAFVEKNTEHILRTWVDKRRPNSLNFDDHHVTWVGLVINETEDGGITDNAGTVNFTSTYIEQDQLCSLSETSTFIKKAELWYYVDGACEVAKSKIKRNNPCPCGSQKKFKRCCLAQ